MSNLHTIPDDILILICQNLLLPDLFNIRLTIRRIDSLIVPYGASISRSVALKTFPKAGLLLRCQSSDGGFAWLKDLVPKYLAAVAVDRFRLTSLRYFMEYHYIPAESDLGDSLRAKVRNGWILLKDLSNISKDMYKLRDESLIPSSSSRSLKERMMHHFERKNSINRLSDDEKNYIRKREQTILGRRLAYLKGCSSNDIADYQIMFFFLDAAFRTKQYPEVMGHFAHVHLERYEGPDYFDWDSNKRVCNGDSWVNWAILHEGPEMFWEQWWGKRNDYVREKLLRMWEHEESPEAIAIKRNAASEFANAVSSRSRRHCAMVDNVEEELSSYMQWEHGLQRFHSGEPLPPAWMDDIPYLVDFLSDIR